jgi:hypothetical protein
MLVDTPADTGLDAPARTGTMMRFARAARTRWRTLFLVTGAVLTVLWGRAGQRRGAPPGHPAPAVHPAARNRIQRLHLRGPAGRVALARVDRVHAARPAAPVPVRPMPGTGRGSNAPVGHLQASRLAAAPANSHRQTRRNDAGRRYTRTCSYPPHSPWVSQ